MSSTSSNSGWRASRPPFSAFVASSRISRAPPIVTSGKSVMRSTASWVTARPACRPLQTSARVNSRARSAATEKRQSPAKALEHGREIRASPELSMFQPVSHSGITRSRPAENIGGSPPGNQGEISAMKYGAIRRKPARASIVGSVLSGSHHGPVRIADRMSDSALGTLRQQHRRQCDRQPETITPSAAPPTLSESRSVGAV